MLGECICPDWRLPWIKLSMRVGVKRGDWVRMWMKAKVTIGWLVRCARRRGVVVYVAMV